MKRMEIELRCAICSELMVYATSSKLHIYHRSIFTCDSDTQGVMLVILMVALANFVAGMDLIRENWSPGYTVTDGQMRDAFSVFSVYFPAGIGILAGAKLLMFLAI
ncbi:hypothetical protein DAPPUDRAFT_333217 [Daphnia pulex]|nr:hypothetical protein DAPPUDRAFT_333217 [Daphnia pulex]|eukprot:EFX65403.1 hypothetical protein DAPPUDRAFT_333217 [Daphnia pulex]